PVIANDVPSPARTADLEDRHDLRVIGESRQRLALPRPSCGPGVVRLLRVEKRDRHVTVKPRIGGEIDSRTAVLVEQPAEPIATAGERRGWASAPRPLRRLVPECNTTIGTEPIVSRVAGPAP